jgi:WD40 repeat protein
MRICKNNNDSNFVGIIFSSKVIFTSFRNLKIKGIYKTKNNIFFSGCFRRLDERIFAVTGKNKKIDIFDVKNHCLLRTLLGHENPVYSLCFSIEKSKIISGGNDSYIKIWDVPLEKCEDIIKNIDSPIRSVSYFLSHTKLFGTSSYKGEINLYDLRQKKKSFRIFNHGCPIEKFAFIKNEKEIISIGGNHIKIWNIIEKKINFSLKMEKAILNVGKIDSSGFFFNALGQEIKYYDFYSSSSFTIYSFNKEITCFESFQKGFLIGFIDGKLCFKKNLTKGYYDLLISKEFCSKTIIRLFIIKKKSFLPKKKNKKNF